MIKKVGAIVLLPLVICVILLFSSREPNGPEMKIGVPDSAAALIISYIVNEKMARSAGILEKFSVYPTKDCCTTTAEWALSTGALEIAVMCPEAAQRLIDKDSRYEIVGPCAVNSDVVVVRNQNGSGHKKIAVAYRRDFQKSLVERLFGRNATAVPMVSSAIPFAYEKRAVDGVVIDILTGFQLQGKMIPSFGENGNLVTYVLVVRKTFKENPFFRKFLDSYKDAVDDLSHDEILLTVAKSYGKREWSEEEVKQWKRMGVRFTLPWVQDLSKQSSPKMF